MIPIIREIRSELRSDAAYSIYSTCMYKPSQDKYHLMVDEYLSDSRTRCFGAFDECELAGMLIAKDGEILGIAVRKDRRYENIGRALIQHAGEFFPALTAETDDDSVGFYRHCGFFCEAFERTFPDGACIRYRCKLNQ